VLLIEAAGLAHHADARKCRKRPIGLPDDARGLVPFGDQTQMEGAEVENIATPRKLSYEHISILPIRNPACMVIECCGRRPIGKIPSSGIAIWNQHPLYRIGAIAPC